MEGGSAFRWNVIRLVLKTFIKRKMNILSFYCYEARPLNGSLQPANFAGYFTWTHHLPFFGNYPPKSQNLMMSWFCSNTLICVPECWKCTLRGPDFKIFPSGISWTHCNFRHLQVAPVAQVFSFSTYATAFATHLKPYLKPREAVLEHWSLRVISMNWIYTVCVCSFKGKLI